MPAPLLSIVMPAHNEAYYLRGSVEQVVAAGRRRAWQFEVILVENGSADRTAEVAASLTAAHREVRTLSWPEADYGAALRAGFEAAAGDVVVNFDVDYVDTDFAETAAALVRSGAAVVIGSKRCSGAADRRGPARRAATAVFVGLLKAAFGLHASDTHGLKAMDRRKLAPLVAVTRSRADIFDTELVLRAERAALRVEEVPVAVAETRPARTALARRVPRTVKGLVRLRWMLWAERGGPGLSADESGDRGDDPVGIGGVRGVTALVHH